MPTARKTAVPQDRKPKADEVRFEFSENGKVYAGKPTETTITPGFLRRTRKLDDLDAFFTLIEELFDEDALKVIDTMSRPRFKRLQKDFYEHLEVTQGE